MSLSVVIKWILMLLLHNLAQVSSTACNKAKPSEYAYRNDSVIRMELPQANCRNYPKGPTNILGVSKQDYVHCNGTELRLTDSYHNSSYYEWSAGMAPKQLLFIFPTRVNLTTITLHYYSESQQDLPNLRFYIVPHNFNVWKTPVGIFTDGTFEDDDITGSQVNTVFNFTTNTLKVLMVLANIKSTFFVSEVEFYTCPANQPTISSPPDNLSHTASMSTPEDIVTTTISNTTKTLLQTTATDTTNLSQDFEVDTSHNFGERLTVPLVSTIIVVILALLVILFILIAILYCRKQKHKQQAHIHSLETNVVKANEPYSTFQREGKQPLESSYDASALYDQIHLSPCTGQSEVVTESVHKIAESPMDAEYAESKGTENSTEALETENVLGSPVYAVVDKKKKKKTTQKSKETESNKDTSDKDQPTENQVNLEEMYAVVNKKAKKKKKEQEETRPPSIPEQTVEALYTAVQK